MLIFLHLGFFSFYLLIDFYFPFQLTLLFSAVSGSHTILSILLLYPLAGGQVPCTHRLSIYSSLTDWLRNGVQPTLLRRKERKLKEIPNGISAKEFAQGGKPERMEFSAQGDKQNPQSLSVPTRMMGGTGPLSLSGGDT